MVSLPHQPLRRFGYWLVLALVVASYVLCAAQEGSNPNSIAFIVQLATVAVTLWVAQTPPRALRVWWGVLAAAVVAVVAAELGAGRVECSI